MITLLSSLLLGTSIVSSATDPAATQAACNKYQSARQEQNVPFFPYANQHTRNWPGTSIDGRVAIPSKTPVRARPMFSGGTIQPISTVTLLQGWMVQNYTDAQWQSLFQSLANQGITSVVFAASVDESEGSGQVLGTSNAYPAGIATAWYPVSGIVSSSYPNVAYPGNATGASRSPIAECLYYAQHNGVNNGMSVYLGLNFYADEWGFRAGNASGSGLTDPITDSAFCSTEANLGALVASDLNSQFGGYSSFAGWYWPWEVDNVYFDKNIGSNQESFLPQGYATAAYNNLIAMLETSYFPLAGKPRLISPFFNPYYMNTASGLPYSAYTAAEYGNLWQQIFATTYQGSNLFANTDIFAPQDGAGDYQPQLSATSSLQGPPSIPAIQSVINTWYPPLLQAATKVPGMQVWANADTYQVDVQAYGASAHYVENDPAYPTCLWVNGACVNAGMSRIAAQFQTEATVSYAGTYHIAKIMNCSNAYYDDPLAVWANSAWSTAWKGWQVNQSLGSTTAPTAPISAGVANTSGHCQLALSVASSPNGACGFEVWRDSYTPGTTPYVFCQVPVATASSTTFTDPDSGSASGTHTYYVAAYDVYGNLSPVSQFNHTGSVQLTLSRSSVAGGTAVTGTITLTSTAPANGLTFSLSTDCVNATVAPSVTVASGSTKATFTVNTTSVATLTAANVTASVLGTTLLAPLIITADTVSSLSVSPSTIYGGSTATGTVTLHTPAGPQGILVNLSSDTACATVQPTVMVAPGATTATFSIATTGVTGFTTVGITAGIGSSSQTVYVGVVPAGVASISLSPSSVVGGSSSFAVVTLNGVAGPGGEVVALSSNIGSASVQSTVTVPAGARTATFTITTIKVTSTTTATITASADYVSASATLTINHS